MELIDRAFYKGISTVRALTAEGLPRPPAETRIELYGLYKQATEGDIRDVIQPNDESGAKKWDSWKSFQGLHPSEAKKRYISLLLETMREYATSTTKARELLNELEISWDQVRDIPTRESSPAFGLGLSSLLTSPDRKRDTDIDDAELRQWKREVSRAMETINEQVYLLRHQLTEMTSSQNNTLVKQMLALLRPLGCLLYKVGRHVVIDFLIFILCIYAIRFAKKRPQFQVSRVINYLFMYFSKMLVV